MDRPFSPSIRAGQVITARSSRKTVTTFYNKPFAFVQVAEDECGWLEDRRPSASCDPYRVTEALVRSIVLDDWSS